MRTVGFLVLTAMFFGTTDGRGTAEPLGGDLAKLQGTWSTVLLVSDGKTLIDENTPPPKGPTAKLAYKGDHWLVKVEEKTVATGKTKLDSTKRPKELDVLDESGVRNEKTKLAIYELDGDTYRYCIARAGQPRPKNFESAKGSGHSLIVSKRDKP